MGDVINSRKIADDVRKQLLNEADSAFTKINSKYSASIMAEFGMVRGDAFEGILLTASQAPAVVQEIIRAFFNVNRTCVRICISLGQLTTVGRDRNKSDGPAFWEALKGLDELKENKSEHWLQISFKSTTIEQPLIESQLKLLTALTEDWTDKQREVSWLMDEYGGDIDRIAKDLDIKLPVARKHIAAANYNAYKSVWDSIENYYIALDEQLTGEKPEPENNYLVFFNVAMRKYGQADFEKALQFFKKADELAEREPDIDKELLVEINICMTHSYVRLPIPEYSKAFDAVKKAKSLQEGLPKARRLYIRTLYCESDIYLTTLEHEKSKPILDEALALAITFLNENDTLIGAIKNDMATYYMDSKDNRDYYKAIEFLKDSIKIKESNGNTNTANYATNLYNLAYCYENIGDYNESINAFRKAKAIYEDTVPPDNIYLKNTEQAIRRLEKKIKES
jgi:tetratricopeptide (TPR) repeat protein